MKEYLNDHVYGKEYEVRYDDVDGSHEMKAVSVLNYLEDVALAHSAYMGYPLDWYLGYKNVWVLTQWVMEMRRYPRYGETFTVETWASDFGRFRATRNFRLKDKAGEALGLLSSQWIFFDLVQRRPTRTPDELKQNFGIHTPPALEYEFGKLSFEGAMESYDTIEIRRSDVDAVNHVNNKRYVEWMTEAIPLEIYNTHKIRRMEIAYLKEALYGSPVRSGLSAMGCGACEASFFHRITSLDGQVEHAAGKTYWEKI